MGVQYTVCKRRHQCEACARSRVTSVCEDDVISLVEDCIEPTPEAPAAALPLSDS